MSESLSNHKPQFSKTKSIVSSSNMLMSGDLEHEFDKTSSVMESGDGSESNRHSMTHTETTVSESDLLTPSKKSSSSSSPSSSSSSSSSGSSFDEDFFQLEDSENSKLKTGITSPHKLDDDIHLPSKDGEKDVPIVSSPKSEGSDLGSPGPTSPPAVSGMSPGLILQSGSVKQSPPIQVMDRSDEPAPYRIPSSVFARSKSITPQEWSVASNESLFSIHVGNNSFSREQMILMGRSGELGKSGELVFPLNKSGELVFPLKKSGELIIPDTKSGELINYQISAPQGSTVVQSDRKSSDLGEGLGVTEAAAETMKEVLRVAAADRNKAKTPTDGGRHSSSVSHRSDGSATSINSFAFPILTGDGGKSSSAKTDPEQQPEQQLHQQDVGATPNASGFRWFSCFSCCPFCR
ncbi:hypothetical protein BVC80_8787g24 [Macleaya cordata]|uniref:Uncharacterized protein n=1 Tax=Macleaya cordata TaxID=56857 RepID=A0A200PVA6_MACCD|nr:hypothetical protein BVC80_8787g24 [Macleaya cordata]